MSPGRRDHFARFTTSVRRGLGGASAALATTDGRWALVSTSMTALVAGAIAWMAMGVVPLDRPMVAPGRSMTQLPGPVPTIGDVPKMRTAAA